MWIGLALLFGLLGGAAIFAFTASDRTDSAFDRLEKTTLAPDLIVGARCSDKTCIGVANQLSTLPSVLAAAPVINYLGAMTAPNGKPLSVGDEACYTGAGEIDLMMPADGRWGSNVNRFALAEGSLPDPASTDQVLIASEIARRFRLRVGDLITLSGDACDQPEGVSPLVRRLRVVGIERSTLEQQPEIGFYILGVHGTTALLHDLEKEGIQTSSGVALRLRARANDATVVREAADRGIEIAPIITFADIRRGIARGTRPDSIAALILGMFAIIAAVAVIGPALIQQAAASGEERRTLKVLGLTRADLVRLGIASGVLAGVISAVTAVIVAIALSPLSPIGEARRFDPRPGMSSVLYLGAGMLLTILVASALVTIGTLVGAKKVPLARFKSATSASRLVRALHLRPTMATGVRMALEPRRNSGSVLALGGVFFGVVGLIAAMTFSSSLEHFDRTPSLVGWNWDMAAFFAGNGDPTPTTDDLQAKVRNQLLAIPGVAQASFATFFPPQISLLGVDAFPIAFSTGVDSIRPSVISGRAPVGPSEILLNPRLAERLGVRIGDRVELRQADPRDTTRALGSTRPFEIVGTGVVPIGDGRVDIGFALTLEGLNSLVPGSGPHLMLFNLEPGADRQKVKAALVAARVSEEGSVIDRVPSASKLVQLDKARVASTPRVAAGLFAVTAAAVLIHSVIATGRRRRRELAIFRAIGFSARQATSASVWLALTSAFVALVVSVPIGAALGERTWSLYAESLGVGVRAATRASDIVLVVASALLGAAAVAFWPGWIAARRATATTLRTE